MAAGRKPLRDVNSVAIGERFRATKKEALFAKQYRYHYRKKGIEFHVEREGQAVYFKRVA